MNTPIDQTFSTIKRGSKSFALASLFLPKTARPPVYALYSWCRACDDLVDDAALDGAVPDLALAKSWALRDPLLQSLIEDNLCLNWHFDEMIRGMKMDLEHQGYPTLQELEVYGFRVAGVVGLMMCPLIGVRDPRALNHAVALGIAMQLTNICRDVFEDANRGRVYLPLIELGQPSHGAAIDLLKSRPDQGEEVVKNLLVRADRLYAHGRDGLGYIPVRARFAIALAARVYQLIGHRLLAVSRKDAARAFRRRTVVPWPRKALAFFEALVWTFRARRGNRKQDLIKLPDWSFANPEALNR